MKDAQNVGFGIAVPEHAVQKTVLVGGFASRCPAEDGGVSYSGHTIPVGEQSVQGGGVGKGGIFAHGSVGTLLVVVGAEGRSVERDQRSTAALRPRHSLDARMEPCQGSLPPSDQTAHHLVIAAGFVLPVPGVGHRRVLADRAVFVPENQVPAFEKFLQVRLQHRVLCRLGRVPMGEKGCHSPGGGRIGRFKQLQMQRLGGGEAGGGALRFALAVNTQQVAAVVAEKVGCYAYTALYRRGHGKLLGAQHCFFAPGVFLLQTQQLYRLPLAVQKQAPAYLGFGPARTVDLAQPQQIFVILGQCLENHRNTSQSRVCSTPRSSLARK